MVYSLGDHLFINCLTYTHHGLYAGSDYIIHKCRTGVELSTLDSFSEGKKIQIKKHLVKTYSPEESVERAFSRLGEDEYNLIFDNCEHFVNWCILGLKVSQQVMGTSIIAFAAMETIWREYDKHDKIPEALIRYVVSNEGTAKKISEIISNNPRIYSNLFDLLSNVGGFAKTSSEVGKIASVIGGTTSVASNAGIIAGGAAGGIAGVGVVATGAATATGVVGAVAAATVVAPVAIAVGVGYGVKKIWDWITD